MAIVNLIDEPATGARTYELLSPATREPVGTFTCATTDEVDAAVAKARAAQPAWAALGPEGRAKYLRAALANLIDRMDDIIDVICRESGKPATEALMIDVFAAADSLAYYAKNGERFLRSDRRPLHGILKMTKKLEVNYQALGVVGVISPWNGPLILSLNPAVQALIAGNTVVVKPSEVTPHSGKMAVDLFAGTGLPDGVLQCVLGDGAVGAALVNADLDKVHFTGSVATGRKIAEACATKLRPYTLELGGKDAMVICADADVELAAAGAVAGSMFNTGQYCCGTERVYVHESIAERFTAEVVRRVKDLKQGTTGEFDVGAMCFDKQLDKVVAQVDAAIADGATVLTGGSVATDLPGIFFQPTVMTGVTHDMSIMRDETFGPVLPIVTFSTEDEAIRLANDSEYGLSGSVWSKDIERAKSIARHMHTGLVCINDMAMTYGIQEAPFGGRRDSGVGQANGAVGVRSFCFAQPIIVDRLGGKQTADTYPYSVKGETMMKKIIKATWGKGAAKFK